MQMWLLCTLQNIYKIMNDVTIISSQHVHCIMLVHLICTYITPSSVYPTITVIVHIIW